MVSVLASSAVDCGFGPPSDQIKDCIGNCCLFAKHAALRSKNKDWLTCKIMCPSGSTCLPVDCYFSELAL